jgi:hypothetical protein
VLKGFSIQHFCLPLTPTGTLGGVNGEVVTSDQILQSPDAPLQVEVSANVGDVVYLSGDTAGITGTDTGLVVTVCSVPAFLGKLSSALEQRPSK